MVKIKDDTLDHLGWLRCPYCGRKHYRYRERSQTFKCIPCGGTFSVDLREKKVARVQAPLFTLVR